VPTLSSIQLKVNLVHPNKWGTLLWTSTLLPSVLWCVILQISRNFSRHGNNILPIQAITLQFPTKIYYKKPLSCTKKDTFNIHFIIQITNTKSNNSISMAAKQLWLYIQSARNESSIQLITLSLNTWSILLQIPGQEWQQNVNLSYDMKIFIMYR
jgi:hypothetical protein